MTPLTVDVHAHFYPEAYLRLVEEEGARFGVRLTRSPEGAVIERGPVRLQPIGPAYSDLELRKRAMDRQGVRVHALSLSVPMVHWADADLGERLARAVNDAMVDAHRAYPDRFVRLATLPVQEPKLALQELERVARLPGIRGIYLPTNVGGKELSAPEFFPLYARMEAERLPLLLHPQDVLGAARLAPYFLGNLLGNPFDNAVAAAHLIFGGVLDRFKRLEVCLPHAGGAFPYLVGRLSRGWQVRPECRHLSRRPSAYLRRFTYDTITHSAEALRYLIGLVGAGRVMLGSDYCFDMGYNRPVEVVTRRGGLTRTDQAKILGGNAARMLRIE